jgi:D-sedoheptulose 7-phosphate isomerase
MKKWLDEYFELYRNSLFNSDIYDDIISIKMLAEKVKEQRKKIIIVGNGGSASIASHSSVDFTKAAGIRAINFNEANLITCFANDYGYEHWVENAIKFYGEEGDLAIFVSSSGKSENIINGAKKSLEMGISCITFTGFGANNPLRTIGDINLWVNSRAYNIVEMTHNIWILAVIDLIIGDPEYSA